MDYKKAGVDIEAGYKSVELMKKYVKETMRPEVLGGLGGFSGAFSLSAMKNMENPTLVSGTDGVGTKLKLAFLLDKHDTVGIDCVAMCVNDIACAGGEPLFFLDYIACGKNEPEKIATIVKGVADGCIQSGAALIGGETAEMPGFYPPDEYDLAGFAVGVVDVGDGDGYAPVVLCCLDRGCGSRNHASALADGVPWLPRFRPAVCRSGLRHQPDSRRPEREETLLLHPSGIRLPATVTVPTLENVLSVEEEK